MPCPYFYPVEPLDWPSAPRLPLGDAYRGVCQAGGSEAEPAGEIVRDLCNLGYARGRCPHFPADAGPDAVRFAIAADANRVIRIQWVREADHHPFDHGVLEYQTETQGFADAAVDRRVLRQAQAYLAAYARRKQSRRSDA